MQPEFRAEPGTLYLVATPIGNLRDIGLRALDILRSADRIAAEDTRVTAALLAAYGIAAPLLSYRQHNERSASARLLEHLGAGEAIALVSDAGTPGISDPGHVVVREARAAGFPVVTIPGPNAAAAAVSLAGLAEGRWLFYGFLPAKPKERERALQELVDLPFALVFFESPHRLLAAIGAMVQVFGTMRTIGIARELSKRFEAYHACPLGEAVDWLSADPNRQRGEFVLVVDPAPAATDATGIDARNVLLALLDELPLSQAARLAARITGGKRNALYDLAQELKPAARP